MVITVLVPVLLAGIVVGVLAGTACAVRPRLRRLFAHGHDRQWVRDGVLLALVGIALQIGVRRLTSVLVSVGSRFADVRELLHLPAAARPLPWLDLALDQLQAMLPAVQSVTVTPTRDPDAELKVYLPLVLRNR